MDETLFASNNGRVVCFVHIGGYGRQHLAQHPRARRFETPLDCWEKVTEAERAEWLDEFGTPMKCEDCP